MLKLPFLLSLRHELKKKELVNTKYTLLIGGELKLCNFFLEIILSTRSWAISSKNFTLQTQIWPYSQTRNSKPDSRDSSSLRACCLWGVQETLIQDKKMPARFAFKGNAFSSWLFRGIFDLLIFCSPLFFFCQITRYYLWNISISYNSNNNNKKIMLCFDWPFYFEILKHLIHKDHKY